MLLNVLFSIMTAYGSSNCLNSLKSWVWDSPSPSIQSRLAPSDWHVFRLFKDICYLDTHLRQWRSQGYITYMASCMTRNILCRWQQEVYGPEYQMCREAEELLQKIRVYAVCLLYNKAGINIPCLWFFLIHCLS
jgi:hypothetical protein